MYERGNKEKRGEMKMIIDRIFNDGDNIANTLDRYAKNYSLNETERQQEETDLATRNWLRSVTENIEEFNLYHNYYNRLKKMLKE